MHMPVEMVAGYLLSRYFLWLGVSIYSNSHEIERNFLITGNYLQSTHRSYLVYITKYDF